MQPPAIGSNNDDNTLCGRQHVMCYNRISPFLSLAVCEISTRMVEYTPFQHDVSCRCLNEISHHSSHLTTSRSTSFHLNWVHSEATHFAVTATNQDEV